MSRQLRCFLSASYDTNLSPVKSILAENDIETFDLYDFSIGDSIQQILKTKLRQADFAIFVVSKDSKNLLYEIGVCEGLGKQSLIIIDKEANLPFYIENKLSLTANLKDKDFLKVTLMGFIDEIKSKKKSIKRIKAGETHVTQKYSNEVKHTLKTLLDQTKQLRQIGNGRELEFVVGEIFKTIHLKYADNSRGPDSGIDFAIWSNKLGRVLGNPIIVELKSGILNDERVRNAELQIQRYVEKSEAKVALLIYLDKNGRRIKIQPSLRPLIIAYDLEDFISELLINSFENIILTSRNNIAHGV